MNAGEEQKGRVVALASSLSASPKASGWSTDGNRVPQALGRAQFFFLKPPMLRAQANLHEWRQSTLECQMPKTQHSARLASGVGTARVLVSKVDQIHADNLPVPTVCGSPGPSRRSCDGLAVLDGPPGRPLAPPSLAILTPAAELSCRSPKESLKRAAAKWG